MRRAEGWPKGLSEGRANEEGRGVAKRGFQRGGQRGGQIRRAKEWAEGWADFKYTLNAYTVRLYRAGLKSNVFQFM